MVVDDVEHPEPSTIRELVADEVQGPSLHWPFRHLRRDAIAPGQLAALLGANLQAMLGVEPIRALVVHDQAFASQHGVQAHPLGIVLRKRLPGSG